MNDEELARLASEIREYLEDHPRAADSAEGVAKWWLKRQRFEQSLTKIRQALEYLEAEGVVKKTSVEDPVYSLADRRPQRDGDGD